MAIIGGDQGKAGESKGSGRKADDLRLSCLCLLLETKFELLIYWSENLDQDEIGISEDEFDDLQSLFQVKCCIKFTNDEIQKILMEIHEQKWQMLSRDTGRYIWVIVSDLQIQYPKAFLSGYTRCCNKTHSWKENTFLLYQRRKRDFFLKHNVISPEGHFTRINLFFKGSFQNKFSVKVGNLAQPAWPGVSPPPLPVRWDSQKGKKK